MDSQITTLMLHRKRKANVNYRLRVLDVMVDDMHWKVYLTIIFVCRDYNAKHIETKSVWAC